MNRPLHDFLGPKTTYAEKPRVNFQALSVIEELYGSVEFERPEDVAQGCWKPTAPEVLTLEAKALLIDQHRGNVTLEGAAVVPGVGDGRRALYLNALGFAPVIGIDLNPTLIGHANEIKEYAGKQGLVNPDEIHYVTGDFMDDRTLESTGVRFDDFRFVSAYLRKANLYDLGEKIREKSHHGTNLLVSTHVDWDIQLSGFSERHLGTASGTKLLHRDMYIFTKQ